MSEFGTTEMPPSELDKETQEINELIGALRLIKHGIINYPDIAPAAVDQTINDIFGGGLTKTQREELRHLWRLYNKNDKVPREELK